MKSRIPALITSVAIVVAVNACGDALTPVTPIDNMERAITLFAMNGTPLTLPAAILVRGSGGAPQPIRMDANFGFDLAFDIRSADSVEIHTVGFVSNQLTATHRVGLQLTDAAFADALRAPTSGYKYDSTLTVGLGKTVFVDVLEVGCSASFNGPNIKAKLKIDSLDVANRLIYVDILGDPNCGFKSLIVGKPKD
jgi:hypothetical protein